MEICRFTELRHRLSYGSIEIVELLLVDRLCAVAVFAILAAFLLPSGLLDTNDFSTIEVPLWLAAVVLMMIGAAAFAFSGGPVWLQRVRDGAYRLTCRVRTMQKRLPVALLVTLISHACIFGAVKMAADAMAIDISLQMIAAILSAAMLLQILPFSLFGFGATELGSFGLYVLMGLSPAHAAALTGALYGLHLFLAFIGGGLHVVAWRTGKRVSAG